MSNRPRALTVMAEYCCGDPVWDSGPVDLADLGVSPQLIQRLRDWNGQFEAIALTGFAFPGEQAEENWRKVGLTLAHDLQRELPDIEITYREDHDPRPVLDRRGT